LRLEKLEEIIEITHLLVQNYQYFEDSFAFKKGILNKKSDEKEKYIRQIKALIEISENIKLREKLSRLYVLNSSYLPQNKLKDKIGVFITTYTSISEHTIISPEKKIELIFNNFPKKWEFLEFSNEIENELIQEMNLGYSNNTKYKNDFEKEFKKRYNIK